FTGVRGFEWTNDFHGHLNVYFPSNVTNAKNDGGYADMVHFWSWLQTAPEQGGGSDALVTFNHPGRNPTLTPFDSGFNGLVPPAAVENWNDFEYVNAAVDARVVGIEAHSEGYIDDYVRALSKGWHVGTVGAEDEHGTRWAAPDEPKTVIIAPSRSRADLKAAMQARHMYVAYGSHNNVRLGFAASAPDCLNSAAIQGDRIDCSARSAGSSTVIRFSGLATGLTGATVELRSAGVDPLGRQPDDIANTGAVVFGPAASLTGAGVTVDDQFVGERWYFVVAKDAAGRVIAVSSPIWIKGYRFAPPPQPLLAGVAKGAIRVPVGTPLGGYLRPPVGGDYIPGLEGFAAGDPSVFFAEFLDFLPTAQDHDGVPLAPLPDELRKLTSPYATFSPPSRGYYDSLLAKAVAMYDGHDYVVLVKTDFIGMLDELVQGVTTKVKADTGIDLQDGLIMSATHTHDGPGALANHSTRYFWLAMDAYQPELYNRLVPQLAAVVERALADLQPARIGHTVSSERYEQPRQGMKNLNSFRRDRLPSYDRAANDAMRSRLGLLRIDTAAGAPLAVVINFAAHGIAFDVENQYFSGDVLASAERETEGALNVPLAMLVQNTGGDVSPRADGAPTLQRIERFGKLLAPQVKAAYVKISRFQTAPDLRTVSQRVILSRERLGYTGTEYPYPWGAAQCNNDTGVPLVGPSTDSKTPGCLAGTPPDAIDLADNGVGENGAFLPQDTRLTAARIGSILLLAQPGEPLTEY
ncbi:MAG TPA: neutral/alkaline non-lysosomal ceramidase N-terminal domain-containing protein, partial [Solimonas sp.]|nr:neutral/alkaline non-lysosomal ceramidase N-terminal domain-containing protein [Solimonas sp.]